MAVAFIPKETHYGETRVAGTPDTVKYLTRVGLGVEVQEGAGVHAGFLDTDYRDAGAEVVADAAAARGQAVHTNFQDGARFLFTNSSSTSSGISSIYPFFLYH